MPSAILMSGEDVKYSLVYLCDCNIKTLKTLERKYHEIVGYTVMEDDEYVFYSVEDEYSNPISNHWTEDIVKEYDNHTCWILIKTHPCEVHRIMNDVCKTTNYICDVNNFDVWKTDAKDCLTAVITEMMMD
jgi:hypothetical protein